MVSPSLHRQLPTEKAPTSYSIARLRSPSLPLEAGGWIDSQLSCLHGYRLFADDGTPALNLDDWRVPIVFIKSFTPLRFYYDLPKRPQQSLGFLPLRR